MTLCESGCPRAHFGAGKRPRSVDDRVDQLHNSLGRLAWSYRRPTIDAPSVPHSAVSPLTAPSASTVRAASPTLIIYCRTMVILVPEYSIVDRSSLASSKSPSYVQQQQLSSPKSMDAGLNLLVRIVPSTKEPNRISVLLPWTRSHSALTRSLAAALEIHPRDIVRLAQVENGVEKLLNDDVDVSSLSSGSTVHVVSKSAMEMVNKYQEGRRDGLHIGKIFICLFLLITVLLAFHLYAAHSNVSRDHAEVSNRINTLEQNLVILLNGAAAQNSKTSDRVEQLKLFVDSKLFALSEVVLEVKDGLARIPQKGGKVDGAKKSKQVRRESTTNENDD